MRGAIWGLGVVAIILAIISAIASGWVASQLNNKNNTANLDLSKEKSWCIAIAVMNLIIAILVIIMLVVALNWKPELPDVTVDVSAPNPPVPSS